MSAAQNDGPLAAADPPARTPAGWIERLVCSPGESEETRHRKVQFTFATMLVIPAAVLWGLIYIAFGEPGVAPIPIAYAILTLIDLLLLLRLRRFELFRWTQQTLIFILPLTLQIALGGFVGSSLVILWSFIAVL